MQRLGIQKFFFENLDILIGVAGICLGVLISLLYLISTTIQLLTLGLALILASSAYILLKNQQTIPLGSIEPSIKIVLEIVFFLIFSLSLWVLHISNGRPLLYFILIALGTGVLAISILFVTSTNTAILQIIKVGVLSFNIKYSLFLQNFGVGVDYWKHLADNTNLVHAGFINVLSAKEPSYPLMHIQVAINALISNSPVKDATNYAIIIPFVISSICIFLVAKKIFSVNMGLLALLIVNVTDFNIYWGVAPQTTTYGICLYYFLIFIIFRAAITPAPKNNTWFALTIFLIPVLILSHAVSSFIGLISILGLILGTVVYRSFFDKNSEIFPPLFILLIYGIIMLQDWFAALYNKTGDNSFFEQIFSTLVTYVTENADFLNRPEAISGYAASLPPILERTADTLGLTILIFLAVFGCLFWLSKKYRNYISISMISCTVILLIITFGFPVFGIRNILPSRWFSFFYFFLSIMAAFALLTLTQMSRTKLRIVLCFTVIFSVTFFMTTSTISNGGSPIWLQKTTISTDYTLQEGTGAETLSNISENVLVDSRYAVVVKSLDSNTNVMILSSEQQINKTSNSVFLWRDYMINKPIQMYVPLMGYYQPISRPYILGPEFLSKLDKFNRVYDDRGVEGYYIQ